MTKDPLKNNNQQKSLHEKKKKKANSNNPAKVKTASFFFDCMKTINLEPDDGDHGRGLRRVTPPHRAFCSSSFPCTCVDSVDFALKAPKKKSSTFCCSSSE